MSYSIISQSLRNSSIKSGIQKYAVPLNYGKINQYSSFTKLSNSNTIKLNDKFLKDTRLYSKNNNNLSPLILQLQHQSLHTSSKGLFTKKEHSLFSENFYFQCQNKKYFSTNGDINNNNGEENNNSTEKKDIDPNTFKWTSNSSSVNNTNNNSYPSLNTNNSVDDIWNKKSNSNDSSINQGQNTNEDLNKDKKEKDKKDKEVSTKDDMCQLFTSLKEKFIAFLNNLPSSLDSNSSSSSTANGQSQKSNISSASPFLLWTSFICASSFSSWFFKQLTSSSLISTAVYAGITGPALINFSHLYSQGGKIIPKELGAKECPTTSQLYEVVEEMAKKAGLSETPAVYVHSSEEINALSAGLKNNDSVLMVTSGLLNHMSQDEIKAVIAHMLYQQKNEYTSLGTHLTAMISGFYTPYNFACYIRKCIIDYKQKKPNSLLLDIVIGLSSLGVYLTKVLNGMCYIAQSAFVRHREKQPIPKELMSVSWKSAIRKLYNQPASMKNESLIWSNPSFAHLFLCDGKGEGWEKAANIAENYDEVSKDIQNGNIWKKKNVRSVAEYFSIFPSLKKRSEWSDPEAQREKKFRHHKN